MQISGKSIIGSGTGDESSARFQAVNPRNAQVLSPDFSGASPEETERAVQLAHDAFLIFRQASGSEKGRLLRQIATNIEDIADEVVARAEQETALPEARLRGEIARTCGQLRFLAQTVEEGSWVMARIDRADPARQPAPKPDIRSMLQPLGPIVVFGASNFPLAFSVAGGDTASALATGNPVIVKAHPAHPGTSELVGRAIQQAIRQSNLPEGTFSLLFAADYEIGLRLVQHPLVKGVAFTGSRTAGRALMNAAAARPEPIPCFAEMSSINPFFVLPGALREHGDRIRSSVQSAFTVGAGQFCTKPGLVFLPEGPDSSGFTSKLQQTVAEMPGFHLLSKGIQSNFRSGVARTQSNPAVRKIAGAVPSGNGDGFSAEAAVFETDAQAFLHNSELTAEIFGPATLIVRYSNLKELLEITNHLEGQLTATIHGTDQDLRESAELVETLTHKAGRLIWNGIPTGVEVTHAIVHGGPFPSTSDGRSTSVGSQAIFRFTRPVCYQGFPQAALPLELRDENSLHIWRMIDGELNKEPVKETISR